MVLKFALALAGSAASAATLETDLSTAIPDGWKVVDRASGKVSLTFAVKQQNLSELEATVLRVSDPRSPEYGSHLTRDEVDVLTTPSAESTDALRSFLSAEGIEGCDSNGNGDFISCEIDIGTAEKALHTTYHVYRHTESGLTVRRARGGYTLPDHVASHIDFVSPVARFPNLARAVKKMEEQEPTFRKNTPASLHELYSVGTTRATPNSTNIQACTAFLKQHYKQKDLDSFNSKYMPKNSGQVIKSVGDGGTGIAGVEASLDIEYITAMGAGVNSQFWTYAGSAPDNPENEPFLKWIYQVGNTTDADVPKVFSTSYGECENTVSMAYMERINVEFQKAAARGISLMFATGDNGVGADSGSCTRFCGQWPAGSPWVTGVGGSTNDSPEVAWSGSAGGFSDRYPLQPWQKDAVTSYKNSGTKLPAPTRFNATGRGFPDVAAQATNFEVINGGFTEPVAGTSCACPTFSGIVGLLNDLRTSAGKAPLGLLNPFLYQNAAAFNDITSGNNPGCGTTGFEAAKGWDPVTGLGTPDYSRLAAAVQALP
jgi:tripeptidyl-peptidase-1